MGLVESFRKPGGRFTGIYGWLTDLPAKRLEILKEMVNLKTAKALGLTIPSSVLGRADEIIQ